MNILGLENELFILAFENSANSSDPKLLEGNLHMASFFERKSGGSPCEGYFNHSSTLKLFGRYLGPSENLPFLMISVLRFFIFLKAFLFHPTISSLSGKEEFKHMISISPLP